MTRHIAAVAILWLGLTVAGEFAATIDIYPPIHSDKGEEIEHAFKVLVYLAVPVFAAVVAVLVYVLATRRGSGPDDEGEPLAGKGPVPVAWVAVTSGLTLLVMIYPGLTSLREVMHNDSNPDLTVVVEGVQWTWLVSYPDQGIERSRVMLLPVDREVRFEVTSLDVLHSFWVPAFLMKIDAVPGKTTVLTLKPTEIGSYETEELLRLQCAELCGMSHARMFIPVSVVSEEDFQAWVAEEQVTRSPEPSGEGGAALRLKAADTKFDLAVLEAEAGGEISVQFENAEDVPHNFAVYTDESASEAIYVGEFLIKMGSQTEHLPALDRGTYFFRCDAHPDAMTGELVVR